MQKKGFIIAGLLLALFCGQSAAKLSAEEQGKVNQLATTLALTDAQKSKLTSEREKSVEKLLELEQEWQKLHNQLRREIRKEKPDKSTIDRISNDIGNIQGKIVALRTNSLLYLKSLLTPSQITKLESAE